MSGDIKSSLKEILGTFDSVEFAYLFGSYANHTASNRSDIDVAIFIKKDFDSFEVGLEVHHKLEVELLKDIDLVVSNSVKNYYLLRDIISKGILLKDGETRAMYEVRKQHEIIDFLDFRRMIDAA